MARRSIPGAAALLLASVAAAQDFELVLPPRSKSAEVTAFAFSGSTRVYLGRDDAFCDLDLMRKEQRCLATDGPVSSLAATLDGERSVVVYATVTRPAADDAAQSCTIALHAYDPRDRKSRRLTRIVLTRCASSDPPQLGASRSPRGVFVTLTTRYDARVFELQATVSGSRLEETWRYDSQPRAAGWMASGISVGVSDRAVYVMEGWNDFSDGRIEIRRHDIGERRTELMDLSVPAGFEGLGPSFLLASPDDAELLLAGQVGADPGHFLSYDVASRAALCHFTNRSLRALEPSQDILYTDDGTLLVAAVEGRVVELDRCGAEQASHRIDHLPVKIPFGLRGLQLSADGARLYALLQGGAVGIFDRRRDRVLANLYLLERDEWLAILPEGYYGASRRGHDYLAIFSDNEVIGLNQFYDAFYRPDLVDRRLSGEPVRDLMTTTLAQALRQPPPRVEIVAAPADGVTGPASLRYRIESTGGGIGEVRVFHNGKLLWSDGFVVEPPGLFAQSQGIRSNSSSAIEDEQRGIVIALASDTAGAAEQPQVLVQSEAKGEVFEGSVDLTPVAGVNEVTVAAFNAGNTVQSQMRSASFTSAAPARPSNLYIVAIGIDRFRDRSADLKFAAKDARDAARRLREQALSLLPDERIHVSVLTDEAATRGRLLDHLDRVAGRVAPEDQFVLFVATHGVLKGNQYYMLTHDYDGNLSRDSVISSAELVELSRRIGALSQLVILDSCHAGGVDGIVSGLYDARISVLARRMGLHVYASAGSIEGALDGYRGNGLFTHALLEGLNDNPDADDDQNGEVSVVELGRYASARTRDISERIGHRQRPLLIEFGVDRTLYRLPPDGGSQRRSNHD